MRGPCVGLPRGRAQALRFARAVALAASLAGCGASVDGHAGDKRGQHGPRLGDAVFVADDGARLPLTRWRPEGDPRATVIALHGFTEHGGVFYTLGPSLAAAGYDVVAVDQRGFGRTASRGHWAGRARMVADVRALHRRLRRRHPQRPVHLLGHSMGAALATLAVTGAGAIEPASTTLIAPAFRSWDTLPWIQRVGLRISATLLPGLRPNQSTGRTLAQIQVTDAPRIMRIQATDEHILREVRFDMLAGAMDLMTAARARVDELPQRSLLQLAARDDMVPPRATCGVLARLSRRPPPRPRVALYADGYHFLTRDRQRARTLADIRAWLGDAEAPLPSGAEHSPATAMARLCGADSAAEVPA